MVLTFDMEVLVCGFRDGKWKWFGLVRVGLGWVGEIVRWV